MAGLDALSGEMGQDIIVNNGYFVISTADKTIEKLVRPIIEGRADIVYRRPPY